MADRLWVKLWSSYFTSFSHCEVGPDGLLMGVVLMSALRWERDRLDAWAETETGKPLPIGILAARAQVTPARASAGLHALLDAGTCVRRDDGAWGMPNFGRYQETPDAARKRKVRGDSTDSPPKVRGDSEKCPREEEAEGEGDADADADGEGDAEGDGDRRGPGGDLVDSLTLEPPPADTSSPARPKQARKKPKTGEIDPRAQPVIDYVIALRADLDLRPLDPSEVTDRCIRVLLAKGADVALMYDALETLADDVEADPTKGQWLNCTSPFTGPGVGGRQGGWATSLQRIDKARARGKQPSGKRPGPPTVTEILAERERVDAERRATVAAMQAANTPTPRVHDA